MEIIELPQQHHDDAVELWRACGLTRPWNDPRADLDRALQGTASTVLAAVDESAARPLQGTVMVGHDGHRGWVYYLAVDPGARRRGLGRALMDQAEAWVEAHGIPKLQLMVRATNQEATTFYDRLGYVDQECVVLGKFFDDSAQAMRASAG